MLNQLTTSESVLLDAQILAQAASDAYLPGVPDGWDGECRLISRDGTECLVISNQVDTILAFRGTSDPRDWLTDADTRKLHFDGIGDVHAGFGYAWRSIEHAIYSAIPSSTHSLFITGHSLGGALATVAAAALSSELRIRRVVTFGSPRVLGPPTAHKFNWLFRDRALRVVHSNDIVPRIPGPFRFRHVGIPILIKETPTEEKLTAERVVFGATFFDLLFERIVGFRFDAVSDHMMDNYVRLREIE